MRALSSGVHMSGQRHVAVTIFMVSWNCATMAWIVGGRNSLLSFLFFSILPKVSFRLSLLNRSWEKEESHLELPQPRRAMQCFQVELTSESQHGQVPRVGCYLTVPQQEPLGTSSNWRSTCTVLGLLASDLASRTQPLLSRGRTPQPSCLLCWSHSEASKLRKDCMCSISLLVMSALKAEAALAPGGGVVCMHRVVIPGPGISGHISNALMDSGDPGRTVVRGMWVVECVRARRAGGLRGTTGTN